MPTELTSGCAELNEEGALTPVFSLQDVSLQAPVGTTMILQGLSFDLAAAEMVGLVGPSGAGKSSLLRLLNRLSDRSGGILTFQGKPIEQIPVLQLRQQVTLVNQESRLLGMTVADALHYPLKLRGMAPQQANERVQHWLERLQIPTDWLGRTELELSVGQRQRVAVARGLVIQPLVLLLDEPTSALDIGQSERLLDQLRILTQEHHTTVVMANHQLEWVERSCDRILALQQGQLAGDWASDKVDWQQLRRSIAQAEQAEQDEWD